MALIGLATLPDGGLMFALPDVFLMPGLLLCAVGGLMLSITRGPRADAANGSSPSRGA